MDPFSLLLFLFDNNQLQVANKLFPMPNISQKIEAFAIENLKRITDDVSPMEGMGTGQSTAGLPAV